MKVLLIILAVLALFIVIILSIKAELTLIFDNGWSTKIKILFIEKDIQLTKLLSFLVAPEDAGKEAAEKAKQKKEDKEHEKETAADEGQTDSGAGKGTLESSQAVEQESQSEETASVIEVQAPASTEAVAEDNKKAKKKDAPPKKNPVQKILEEDGVVGILLLVSNALQTVNTAIITLIKGLHIYSLYVKMIIGGGDVANIGEKFGSVCGWYYPLKGMILNQMRVDQYDDLITADFIAPRSEYEFQFIGSISVGLLVKVLLKAGKTFIVNYFKNK